MYEIEREELNKYLMILNTIVADVIRDSEDIIEYLLCAKNGMLHPRLTPTKHIIDQLKKIILHLPPGTHFPFIADLEN